jgi:hypothetical protein
MSGRSISDLGAQTTTHPTPSSAKPSLWALSGSGLLLWYKRSMSSSPQAHKPAPLTPKQLSTTWLACKPVALMLGTLKCPPNPSLLTLHREWQTLDIEPHPPVALPNAHCMNNTAKLTPSIAAWSRAASCKQRNAWGRCMQAMRLDSRGEEGLGSDLTAEPTLNVGCSAVTLLLSCWAVH